MRALRYFVPPVYVVLGIVFFLGVVALGVRHVTLVHQARTAKLEVCAARLQAVVARNPFIEKFARNVDPCIAYEIVSR